MSSDDDKPPQDLTDGELDIAGGWMFEGCYKYRLASRDVALGKDAANLASPPGSGNH